MNRIPCQPCSTSDLDLTSVPPVQSAIVGDYVVTTGPKSTLDGDGPIEFELMGSGDDWTDLGECYLNLKFSIRNWDGSKLAYYTATGDEGAQIACQPINNILHSMFKQVDLFVNDALVTTSNDTYPYRAYLTNLTSYGNEAKDTWLSVLEGWYTDENGEYDAAINKAARRKAKELFKDGRSANLRGRLHVDLAFQGRLLPNNVTARFVLTRSRQEFFMMSFANNQKPFKIKVESATMDVRRVKLAPSEQLRLERVLSSTEGALYPVNHVVTKSFTLTSGVSTVDLDSVFTGQLPTKIIMGMCLNSAYYGAYNHNPYRFFHFDLSYAALNVEGKQLPYQGLRPDVEVGRVTDVYFSLMKNCGLYPFDWSNGIGLEEYEGGSFLFGFDLTPDDGADGVAYWTPRRYGTVKCSLRFRSALAHTVTLIVFGQFDNVVRVDGNRAVTYDYTA